MIFYIFRYKPLDSSHGRRILGIAEQFWLTQWSRLFAGQPNTSTAILAIPSICTGLLSTAIWTSDRSSPYIRRRILWCIDDNVNGRSVCARRQTTHDGQQKRTPTNPKYQFGVLILKRLHSKCSFRYETVKGMVLYALVNSKDRNVLYYCCFSWNLQIKTLRLATSYISYLTRVLEGDQDPSGGFRAELVPSSRKINAERRARNEAQVRHFTAYIYDKFKCIE